MRKIQKKQRRQKFYFYSIYILMIIAPASAYAEMGQSRLGEVELTRLYCAYLGGEVESPLLYWVNEKLHYVFVDCETDEEVIEAGLDKASSLDSVQQVKFFHELSEKRPVIVIYDTDGIEGTYEYRIRKIAQQLNIEFRRIEPKDFIE